MTCAILVREEQVQANFGEGNGKIEKLRAAGFLKHNLRAKQDKGESTADTLMKLFRTTFHKFQYSVFFFLNHPATGLVFHF